MKENPMGNNDIITAIRAQLGESTLDPESKSDRRAYLDIPAERLESSSRVMLDEFGARFQIATAVDTEAGYEVLYHWALDEKDCIITFRILLEHDAPELDSIALMCPAAEWIEREMWELMGIQFNDHPDMRHLLLADDWPEGNFPMRKNHGATT
jgi:Ni,Fe-hydrogenase III component G